MKNYKIYGDERTSLNLSDKAEREYNAAEFDAIIEREVDGKPMYEIYNDSMGHEVLVRGNMTAEEVSAHYEDAYDEYVKGLKQDIKGLKQDILDKVDSNLTPEEAEAAGYLTVNTARNGRDVLWFFDGINQLAYYIDNNDKLTDEEIEEQLM